MILKSVVDLDGSLYPILRLNEGIVHNGLIFSKELKNPIPVRNVGSINGVKNKTNRVSVDFRQLGILIDNQISLINPMLGNTNCSIVRLCPEDKINTRAGLVNELFTANRSNYYEFSIESVNSGRSLHELSVPFGYEFCTLVHDYTVDQIDRLMSCTSSTDVGLAFTSKLIHLFIDKSHHFCDDEFDAIINRSILGLKFKGSHHFSDLRNVVDSYYQSDSDPRRKLDYVVQSLKYLYKYGHFHRNFLNKIDINVVSSRWCFGLILLNHSFDGIYYPSIIRYNNLDYSRNNRINKISSMIRFIMEIQPIKERFIEFDEDAFTDVVPNYKGNLVPVYDHERDLITLKNSVWDGNLGPMRFVRW